MAMLLLHKNIREIGKSMKLEAYQILHCDAGWRNFSFLKLVAEDGTIGISEYNESYGSPGLTGVIEGVLKWALGKNPFAHERLMSELYARTRQAHGGIAQQALAAIENALVDLKARSFNIPVYELLGGAVRERLNLYWSHCGSYRLPRTAGFLSVEPVLNLDDIVSLGREVVSSGFSALKTNIFLFDDEPHMHQPGFAGTEGWPELNSSRKVREALREQLLAFREGAGPDTMMLLDLNFNYKTEGYLSVTRALDDLGLGWFEIDLYDPEALALIRRPFFEAQAMDVSIVDVPWNGIWQSLKIAALAESFEVNVAPHNFYGHLSTLMSAHFCAAIPNFRIMEIDIDDVPWKDDLVTVPPKIENGCLVVPDGPGWGTELDEAAIAAHPPKNQSNQ